MISIGPFSENDIAEMRDLVANMPSNISDPAWEDALNALPFSAGLFGLPNPDLSILVRDTGAAVLLEGRWHDKLAQPEQDCYLRIQTQGDAIAVLSKIARPMVLPQENTDHNAAFRMGYFEGNAQTCLLMSALCSWSKNLANPFMLESPTSQIILPSVREAFLSPLEELLCALGYEGTSLLVGTDGTGSLVVLEPQGFAVNSAIIDRLSWRATQVDTEGLLHISHFDLKNTNAPKSRKKAWRQTPLWIGPLVGKSTTHHERIQMMSRVQESIERDACTEDAQAVKRLWNLNLALAAPSMNNLSGISMPPNV